MTTHHTGGHTVAQLGFQGILKAHKEELERIIEGRSGDGSDLAACYIAHAQALLLIHDLDDHTSPEAETMREMLIAAAKQFARSKAEMKSRLVKIS